jgi:sigma-B regulation protein RsbU (phosphoserine phosphatase)
MDAMELNAFSTAREQIVDRRQKLESAIGALGPRPELTALLAEVDAALERISVGTYGLCEECHTPIEADRLIADPLVRLCLDHLTPSEQRALEQDLQLAARVQQGLLPDVARTPVGWDIAYSYRPARIVSGDYCDIVALDGELFFMLGDVSGKGVAAATVMAQLHAMFRALLPVKLSLCELLERASRLLCESTLPTHYATLVCARAAAGGIVEICNAGHVSPLVAQNGAVEALPPGGMPVGLFCSQRFELQRLQLGSGGLIVLCSDGVTDAENDEGEPYGIDRLHAVVHEHAAEPAARIVDACAKSVDAWRGRRRPEDDLTLMAVRRA